MLGLAGSDQGKPALCWLVWLAAGGLSCCRMLHRSIRCQLHGSSPRPPLAQGADPYSDQLLSRVIAQSGPATSEHITFNLYKMLTSAASRIQLTK